MYKYRIAFKNGGVSLHYRNSAPSAAGSNVSPITHIFKNCLIPYNLPIIETPPKTIYLLYKPSILGSLHLIYSFSEDANLKPQTLRNWAFASQIFGVPKAVKKIPQNSQFKFSKIERLQFINYITKIPNLIFRSENTKL